MAEKAMNDAAAYIRSLAQLRGRNAVWAERAVRESVSLSARDALQQKVIDYIADDTAHLLAQADGRRIRLANGSEAVLATRTAPVVNYEAGWRIRLLSAITSPGVALILMMIGIYGLFFEFYNPGFVVPGVIGAICLILGLYALQQLPLNYAGLGLIVLGIAFMVAEAFMPSFGVLGLGGVAAFVFGAIILIDTEAPGFGIPPALIVGLALISAVTIAGIAGLAFKARRRPVVSGEEELVGGEGVVVNCDDGQCWARVHSELWKVRCAEALQAGARVRVTGRDGLVLDVSVIGGKGE
jgi:membrane-bound serine protease (ClpP class)